MVPARVPTFLVEVKEGSCLAVSTLRSRGAWSSPRWTWAPCPDRTRYLKRILKWYVSWWCQHLRLLRRNVRLEGLCGSAGWSW